MSATTSRATTPARTRATRVRRGSHARIVVIVPEPHDAPTDDAPITRPMRIAMNEMPRRIDGRSAMRICGPSR